MCCWKANTPGICYRSLNKTPSTKNIPVYVVTVVDNKEKALSLGADAFHAKPLDRVWLLQQLQQVAHKDNRPHVLIVDDDEVARYLLRGLLAQTGFALQKQRAGLKACATPANTSRT